jgi:hypothetical protein
MNWSCKNLWVLVFNYAIGRPKTYANCGRVSGDSRHRRRAGDTPGPMVQEWEPRGTRLVQASIPG